MNISLPDELRSLVDGQVQQGGYGSTSKYARDLIRRDQDRQRLRALLPDGAASPQLATADASYFDALRAGVQPSDE